MESVFEPKDFISMMPDDVVISILHRLPIQDAVRTGILSRNWRSKWTMLGEIIFDRNFYAYLRKRRCENSFRRILSRLLLQFNGAITKSKLDLSMLDAEDILHMIMFLSNKGIKDLTLENLSKPKMKLSTHLFSCLELKHLTIFYCGFDPPPCFRGFPNLLSLSLYGVEFGGSGLGEFITRCPLLEILELSFSGKVKLVDIAKLENLKELSLKFIDLDTGKLTSSSIIYESVCSFPKLQELELNFLGSEMIEGFPSKSFSIAFSCIKALILSIICLDNGTMLSCAFELIWSLPNLQTLEITSNLYDGPPLPVDYKTTGQLQLRNVICEYVTCSENELCLLKYLLACSPFLKKIVIRPSLFDVFTSDEKLKFAIKLLKLHRASPAVDIDLS